MATTIDVEFIESALMRGAVLRQCSKGIELEPPAPGKCIPVPFPVLQALLDRRRLMVIGWGCTGAYWTLWPHVAALREQFHEPQEETARHQKAMGREVR